LVRDGRRRVEFDYGHLFWTPTSLLPSHPPFQ
jgi:hypothetical protein